MVVGGGAVERRWVGGWWGVGGWWAGGWGGRVGAVSSTPGRTGGWEGVTAGMEGGGVGSAWRTRVCGRWGRCGGGGRRCGWWGGAAQGKRVGWTIKVGQEGYRGGGGVGGGAGLGNQGSRKEPSERAEGEG